MAPLSAALKSGRRDFLFVAARHANHEAGEGELSVEDVTPNTASLLVFSRRGYLKRMRADLFSPQARPQLLRSALLHVLHSAGLGVQEPESCVERGIRGAQVLTTVR